ncbi:uncharacterized protein F4812DRAFT_462175 [Daldinia caldariorum]|uniref:uncharacterized protein n=1 Tax=Daldinia caldariorum TaxID=326644 RepID=UPI0020088E77|nr:uncharacterized protein F4812DRAFT_462175 [Daldinia caldariorum]KAI1464851.1 hypothetical protein F4812DRAFT_462175 [Daldinia caldariorum]
MATALNVLPSMSIFNFEITPWIRSDAPNVEIRWITLSSSPTEIRIYFAFNGILSNMDNFIWCPLGCGQGQLLNPRESQPWVFCPNDRDYFCVRHRVAWHHGFTCEAFDALTNRQSFQHEVPIQTHQRDADQKRKEKEELEQRRARLAAEEAATDKITMLCERCPRRIIKDGGW